jgi:tetratricopeptide (TPR) repeat protein
MNNIKLRNALIIGLAVVLAWRVLSLGMADHLAVDKPGAALFWRSGHPEALLRMAEKCVSRKQWPEAREYALKALKANKLDGRALRVLGQVAEHQGDEKRAAELFNKAVALSPRDLPSHVWLLEYSLRNRQAKPAAEHLDALLRVAPELANVLLPQAAALAVNPAAQDAVLGQLALNPPWRRHLLMALAASGYSADQIVPVYVKLNAQSKLEPGDYLPLIDRLNKEGRYPQAYLTWANLIPEKQRKYLGNVFDGGFELPLEEQVGAYGWLMQPVDGAQAQLYSTSGTLGENSFYLEFEGRRTPYAHLSQMLALPPGQWRLSFRAKADRLDSVRGLVWRIICQADGSTLAETEPMRGRFDWREFTQTFEIAEACAGQRLILMIPARIPAETLVNGALWLDDVKIQRFEPVM